MFDTKNFSVGIISDGKYGERAFENISKKLNARWILVEEIPTNVLLDEDIDINLPECSMYISYVRHPDVIMQLAEYQKPLILGVLPGEGLYHQLKSINPYVVRATTMCSLESNTEIPEVDYFTKIFGKPIYEVNLSNENIVESIRVERSSLCGSSEAGADFLLHKSICVENLQEFALRICHECRAPRFGRTCDKEVAGIIHLKSFLDGVPESTLKGNGEEFGKFVKNVELEYIARKGKN